MKTSDTSKTIVEKPNCDIYEMARPDFSQLGVGRVAYMRTGFKKFQFVYDLLAADGSVLLKDASMDTVQNFVFEHGLELITLQ